MVFEWEKTLPSECQFDIVNHTQAGFMASANHSVVEILHPSRFSKIEFLFEIHSTVLYFIFVNKLAHFVHILFYDFRHKISLEKLLKEAIICLSQM